jgi:hypothetical protein
MLDKINVILNKKFKENIKGNSFDLLEDAPEAECKIARFQYIEAKYLLINSIKNRQEVTIRFFHFLQMKLRI